MRIRVFLATICMTGMIMFGLASCSSEDDPFIDEPETTEETGSTGETENAGSGEENDTSDENDDDFVTNSQTVTFENAVTIAFDGTEATVENPFDGAGVTVTQSGAHVVITSTITDKELNYVLSGVTGNGSLKIYGSYKFGIVLNGTSITNPKGAAINNQCGKKTTVTVVAQTNNRLKDGKTYTYTTGEDMKATFFSEGQLNFYGTGNLQVYGNNKHAICVDDYFRMYEGNITIASAASDGIHANDYIRIDAGTLTVKSTGEGLDCEKGYIELNGGTINIVTTGDKSHGVKSETYTTVNTTGTVDIKVSGKASKAFKCTGDMTLTKGTLNLVTTGAAFYDTSDSDIASAAGINCDANVLIEGGSLTITSSGSGGKGISADGTFVMKDGTVKVTTSGGQFKYGSNDTAAKAIKSKGNLTVNGGTVTIKTSGVEAEGLESKATLTINGGTIEVEAYDDCINASKHIEITNGYVYCNSSTNDGIDSNGTLTVSGGVIVSCGASAPEDGFDCDQNQFKITGGILVGLGGATSNPTSNVCTQRSLVYGASLTSGSILYIESSSGTEALTLKLPKASSTMLFSSPKLASGTTYTIYTGGSVSGGSDFHGLYTGATYTKGPSKTTFTTSSMVTTAGTTSGGGPGGR